MSTSGEPAMKRTRLNSEEIEEMSREALLALWRAQDRYIDALEVKGESETSIAELDEKLKQTTRREQVLVMRLTTKEHEMQEYLNQIQELKQASHNNSTSQLRAVLLDPAVNLMFERLKKELDETKQKLEQTKMDLSAWKFTPDSQTGKRLMAKCRMLLQENEELGKVTSSGRIAKLEGTIALEKTLVQEMKKGQAEIDDFLLELEEDLEGMQSTIYLQQQQLKEAKDENATLKDEITLLKQNTNSLLETNEENESKVMPVMQTDQSVVPDNEMVVKKEIIIQDNKVKEDPEMPSLQKATVLEEETMEVDKSMEKVVKTEHNDNASGSGTDAESSGSASP